MGTKISAIYRYPVKGLSSEKLERVALVPGECLPHDRRFAIALGSTVFDSRKPEWLPKTRFVMLMRDEKLALLQTSFDADSGVLTIAESGRELLRARLSHPERWRLVAEFYANFLGPAVDWPLRVVEGRAARPAGRL
jgi:MOSC domain-containing protein